VAGNQITEILNHYVNFGWEYVWHCRILAREETDMMHSLVNAVPNAAPKSLNATTAGSGSNKRVVLTWTDNSNNEIGFRIQSATDSAFTSGVITSTVGANVRTFTTGNLTRGTQYYFHGQSFNTGGTSVYVNASTFPITTPLRGWEL
jgi:fibronectin type 3 domain-containing protein